jgi:hypothetical protein
MLWAHFTSSAEAGSLNVRTSPPKGACRVPELGHGV